MRLMIAMSALLLLLTGCQTPNVAASDPAGQCSHPRKPSKPYSSEEIGNYIADQGQAISVCRNLLGY